MLSKEEIEDNIKSKDNDTVETERIMIEIPKNTNFLSIVCFFTDKDGFNANNQILGIKALKERKKYIEQLESDNYELNNRINDYIEEGRKLIEKLEEDIKSNIPENHKNEKITIDGQTYHQALKIYAQEILSILKG